MDTTGKMRFSCLAVVVFVLMVSFSLVSCSGGGGATAPVSVNRTVSGIVTGLTGTGLVLQDNSGDDLTLATNGTFTFATTVASGAAYAVTVKSQPAWQLCLVTNGTGTIISANVTDITVACAAQDWTIGLAAHYKCDGNANDSIGSANGMLSSGFTYTTDRHGIGTSACNFNGVDSKVTVTSSTITTPGSNGFSIAFWARRSVSSFTGSIIYGGQFSIHGSINFTVIPGSTIGVMSSFPQDTWTHIVATYDKNTLLIKIYKDGTFISQATKLDSIGGLYVTELYFGQHAWWPAATYWTGALDEVRLYGRALSDVEVQQLYDYEK